MNGLDGCLYMSWVLLKGKNTEKPSVLQEPVSKEAAYKEPAQTETLPHFTRSGLNKEHLLFIPYGVLAILAFPKKHIAL